MSPMATFAGDVGGAVVPCCSRHLRMERVLGRSVAMTRLTVDRRDRFLVGNIFGVESNVAGHANEFAVGRFSEDGFVGVKRDFPPIPLHGE